MNTSKISLVALTLFTLSGCTGNKLEQLEEQTKALKSDLSDLRGLQAEQASAISQIRGELRNMSGGMEELQHQSVGKTRELEQTLTQLKSRVPPPAGIPEDLLAADEQRIGANSGDAADQYKRSLQQIRSGDFDGARQTLSAFVQANPGTAFTDNGLFWLGLVYDQLGQYDRAVVSFSEVFQKYPAEDMVPAALYYLANSFAKMGSKEDAVLTLQKLADEHARSPFAAKARARLAELQDAPRRRGR